MIGPDEHWDSLYPLSDRRSQAQQFLSPWALFPTVAVMAAQGRTGSGPRMVCGVGWNTMKAAGALPGPFKLLPGYDDAELKNHSRTNRGKTESSIGPIA